MHDDEARVNEARAHGSAMPQAPAIDLRTRIGALELRNPILLASGTCGYGDEIAGLVPLEQIGGVVTKTVTPAPRAGNPPPRIAEVAAGMLNSIGLENVGLDRFLSDKLPAARRLATRRIVSVGGESPEEYVATARRLDGVDGVDALELNLSCPNVSGGMDLAREPAACAAVVGAVRRVTGLPLVAKLTPNVAAMAPIAAAAAAAGADAVSLVNTYLGMAIDIERRRPLLATGRGGLSGPAIRPLALARVWEVSQAVALPVIGIGGIMTAADVIEFLLAGATAVEVGTANFVDPLAIGGLAAGLADYLRRHGFATPGELRGALEIG